MTEGSDAALARLRKCLDGYDADVRLYTTDIAMDDLDEVRAWLKKLAEQGRSRTSYVFTVCELGSDAFIGTVWLRDLNFADGHAELAIMMDGRHLGSGWGTDAQRALLTFAFGTLGLHRVELGVNPANLRAQRSYEKVGFRREAVLRSAWTVNGRPADLVIMGILESEFPMPGDG